MTATTFARLSECQVFDRSWRGKADMNSIRANTRRPKHTLEELRELIVSAATKLIEEGGLEALSAREVARGIGYSPGTLYNAFKDRDDIILTIESRLLNDLGEHLDAVKDTGDARSNVTALAEAYLDFTQRNANLWNLLFEHRLSEGRSAPDWFQEKIDGLMRRIEIAIGPLSGSDDPESAALSARVLWAGVHGITSLSAAGKLANITDEATKTLVRDLVTTYLNGLKQSQATVPGRKSPTQNAAASRS